MNVIVFAFCTVFFAYLAWEIRLYYDLIEKEEILPTLFVKSCLAAVSIWFFYLLLVTLSVI